MNQSLTLDSGFEELNLTVRAYNALHRIGERLGLIVWVNGQKSGTLTIEQLTAFNPEEIDRQKNVGPITVREIESALAEHGFSLRKGPGSNRREGKMKPLQNMYETFIGQIVELRSGGPKMTVAGVRAENNTVAVTWFAGETAFEHEFPILCLNYEPVQNTEPA